MKKDLLRKFDLFIVSARAGSMLWATSCVLVLALVFGFFMGGEV